MLSQEPGDEVQRLERVCRPRGDGLDQAAGGQCAGRNAREAVGREQQQPGNEHEGGRQRWNPPGAHHLRRGEHHNRGERAAEDDIDPKQGRAGKKGWECNPDEIGVESIEARVYRRTVDPQPKRGQGADDDGEQSANRDLRRAGGKGAPADRHKKEQARQRVVLKQDLPDAAQVDIDEAYRPGGPTGPLPPAHGFVHSHLFQVATRR